MDELGKAQPTEAYNNMDQAPPGVADQSSFQDAMQRTNIETPMQQTGNGFDAADNIKRPFEEIPGTADSTGTPKRSMMEGMPGGAPFDVAQAQGQAVQKAAEFLSGQTIAGASAQSVQEEVLKVPNRMVGIIIGRGGETINRLQSESGARIQCAPPDTTHHTMERAITLTGTKEAIASGRMMIQSLVDQGLPSEPSASNAGIIHVNSGFSGAGSNILPAGAPEVGSETMEMMIHQSKVGLVIGKGGETIKRLQQQAGCRMQMIQDGPYTNAYEKPLRIQGTAQAITEGRDLVNELIHQSDTTPAGQETLEVPVPRELVGMVIGRSGEQIRKIQNETGVRIQFQPEQPGRQIRNAILAGTPEGLPKAKVMVEEIVERGRNSTKNISQPGPFPGTGAMGNSVGGMRMGGGAGGAFLGPNQVVDMPVPASRCGLIIGRHGETIRSLQQESGAHIQLNRNAMCGPEEKIFTIGGTPEEISRAQQLIRNKCEMASNVNNHHVGRNEFGQPMMGQMSGQGMYGQQQQQQQGQWGYQMQNQGFNQPSGGAGGVDAQAWAAYYQQYYNQPNMGPAAAAASTQQAAVAVAAGNAGGNPGSNDMQAQWAEYYRQLGYFPGQTQQPSSS
ncbi:far upstream element-binding protein 1-like [Sycon ciliatum]|uniref:far upstream element-binding protein 1-like n=1 Tax=Sycon ciliatum TaxID=27933 RepID=UPI0020AC777C|eukprot:scpid36199/ scgid30717/ Far upstream element-binding protein 1; DNA helicase V